MEAVDGEEEEAEDCGGWKSSTFGDWVELTSAEVSRVAWVAIFPALLLASLRSRMAFAHSLVSSVISLRMTDWESLGSSPRLPRILLDARSRSLVNCRSNLSCSEDFVYWGSSAMGITQK